MRFLTADYVFPVVDAPLAGGILAVNEDGSIADLLIPALLDYEIAAIERYSGFICPGFINSHCHLELSWAKDRIQSGKGLDHFLKSLESLRKNVKDEEVVGAIQRELLFLLNSGTVGVGDVVNGVSTLAFKANSNILFHTFAEVYGSHPSYAEIAFAKGLDVYSSFTLSSGNSLTSITPHATYSLSGELFQRVAEHAANTKSILSIHHQESEDENDFFHNGTGKIAGRRMMFNPGIAPYVPSGKRPIESIAGYFGPDQPLILVHNTVSRTEDIVYAENYFSQLSWCFCPNANIFIENKVPDIGLFRKQANRIVLGTDSLASNSSLSLLEEIKTIQLHFPEIPFCELLQWATKNGAEALGFEQLGTFEKGKSPGVVLIEDPDFETLSLKPSSSSGLLINHRNDRIH